MESKFTRASKVLASATLVAAVVGVEYFTGDNGLLAGAVPALQPLQEQASEKVVASKDFLFGKAEITDRKATRAQLEADLESEEGHVHGPGCGHDHAHEAPKAKKAAKGKAAKGKAAIGGMD